MQRFEEPQFGHACYIVFTNGSSAGRRATPGGVNKFPGGASPYAPCNMENLINKFTNKYICFYRLFNVRGAWNKWQSL